MTAKTSIDNAGKLWVSSWPLILLIGFASIYLPTVSIVGYRWTVEASLAGFLLIAFLFFFRRSSSSTTSQISKSELVYLIIPVALFVVWSGLSTAWASSYRSATHHTLLWACYLCFYLLLGAWIRITKHRQLSISVAGVVIAAIGLAGAVEFFGSPKPITLAFTSRYYSYAEVIVMLLPVFAAMAIKTGSRRPFLWILNLALCWGLVVATSSRIMFIAGVSAFLAFGILAWITRTMSPIQWKRGLVIACLLVAVTFLPLLSRFQGENISVADRFSGNEEYSVLSARSRLLLWGLALEGFRSSPVVGIGADNFYSEYKTLRKNLSQREPDSWILEINEDLIPERAHNEYLQILCELGLVGGLLFCWLFAGILYMLVFALRNRVSLLTIGSLSGIVGFITASAASSYSFRFPANGICFFFLLAIAANGTFAKRQNAEQIKLPPTSPRWLLVSGIAVSIAMIFFCTVRAVSINHLANFQKTSNNLNAEQEITQAIAIDGHEPMFRFYYGEYLYLAGRFDEAVPQLSLAIDNGLATSPAYFDLIASLIGSQKIDEARSIFEESLRVYPRSVFLRTAYSSFLKRLGETSRAAAEYSSALAINEKQARSWQLAHEQGLERLVQIARVDTNYLSPFDLKPESAPLVLSNFQKMLPSNLPK